MAQAHWANPVSGGFGDGADWTGGAVPGPADDAVFDAAGADYTVTATPTGKGRQVNSVQLAANATFEIVGKSGRFARVARFAAAAGTGSGANAGTIVIGPRAQWEVAGMIDNIGRIMLNGGESAGADLLLSGDTTLTGGGTISLNGFSNSIGAFGGALTNVDNTIVGGGQIAGLSLLNESSGIIDANDGAAGPLYIGTPQSRATVVTNRGLIEATAGGSLAIENASIIGSGGRIVVGARSYAEIYTSTLTGQTLTVAAGGTALLWASKLDGPIVNAGQINVAPLYRQSLTLLGDVILSGGGSVLLDSRTSYIAGATASVVFTNLDNTINGGGNIGHGQLTLVNAAAGVIDADWTSGALFNQKMVIDTGAVSVANAGLIEATAEGILTIASAVDNTGVIATAGSGTLIAQGAVTGAGRATIDGGVLDFASGCDQGVSFTGGAGVLELAQSQAYTASVTGFAKGGGTALDLVDIGFVSSAEATFSGTRSGGVLTVTDGTHTARIHLMGDYRAATFTASSDGQGGTVVAASTALISAAAAMAAPFTGAARFAERPDAEHLFLVRAHGPGRQSPIS